MTAPARLRARLTGGWWPTYGRHVTSGRSLSAWWGRPVLLGLERRPTKAAPADVEVAA